MSLGEYTLVSSKKYDPYVMGYILGTFDLYTDNEGLKYFGNNKALIFVKFNLMTDNQYQEKHLEIYGAKHDEL